MDVIYKYNDDEVRSLIKDNEIPDYFMDSVIFNNDDEEGNLLWDDVGDEDINISQKNTIDYKDISNIIDNI